MKIINILSEKEEVIHGTTCAICDFTQAQDHVKVTRKDLNENGGITSETDEELKHAKKADLITMPGHRFPSVKVWCRHEDVQQYVTERMCCNFWNHSDVIESK